jgi:hypothetical protein
MDAARLRARSSTIRRKNAQCNKLVRFGGKKLTRHSRRRRADAGDFFRERGKFFIFGGRATALRGIRARGEGRSLARTSDARRRNFSRRGRAGILPGTRVRLRSARRGAARERMGTLRGGALACANRVGYAFGDFQTQVLPI